MISAELARSRVSRPAAAARGAASGERSVAPAPGASIAWVTSAIIMLHEQTQVAKCLWPQAAHMDIPLRHSTVAPHTRHKLNHDREGSARRIRGDRAVRRRLRRSIGESGGGGWGAAEGRGRGRRQVEPWRGVVGSNGWGGRSRRPHRRAASVSMAGVVAWVAASSLPSPPSLPSSMTSSAPLASASASASGARRRLETGPAPTNEQAEQNVRW